MSDAPRQPTPAERVWGRPGLDTMRGFLPRREPSVVRGAFAAVDDLLQAMPVVLADGSAGLLGENRFRTAAAGLEDCTGTIEERITHLQDEAADETERDAAAHELAQLFRDFQYLKMGWLFEPLAHGGAQAESFLPANLARPLVRLAELFERQPWLEYASGYVLMNSRFGESITPHDVSLIRQWHGGPDEFYFQTVHSVIESETPRLFDALERVFRAVETDDPAALAGPMRDGIAVTETMLERLRMMPHLSRPGYYSADVRPQIQGLVGNTGPGKLFPESGVFFEGCGDECLDGRSGRFVSDIRGQTGAQSSIIPLLDNALGICEFYAQGDNPLTRMLRAFRHYRPQPHVDLLESVDARRRRLDARAWMRRHEPLLLARWIHTVARFREFHFYLAMAYIVKPGRKQAPAGQTRAVGTGGSPTPSYLPQHVQESLLALANTLAVIDPATLDGEDAEHYQAMQDYVARCAEVNAKRSTIVGEYLGGEAGESALDTAIGEAEQRFGVSGRR